MMILNRIDEIGEEIVELDAERKQLREIYDGRFIAAAEITRLKQENEKLAIDSVALNEVISVVRNWNRELRSNTLVRMRQIAKIIEERDDRMHVIEPPELNPIAVSDGHKRFMKRMDETAARAYAKYESERERDD